MKHQTLSKPRIQSIREKYALNQVYILNTVKVDSIEYNTLVLETGWLFLKELFPSPKQYKSHFRLFADCKLFWLWWRSEWKQWEQELIDFLKINGIKADEGLWTMEMQQMAVDRMTELSFENNYIKAKTNEKK